MAVFGEKNMRTFLAGIALLFLGSAPGLAQAPARAPDVADIPIARIDDLGTAFDLKAHLYLPPGPGTVPLLLYIHGKGGSYNDARDQV